MNFPDMQAKLEFLHLLGKWRLLCPPLQGGRRAFFAAGGLEFPA